jgi:hypothetical protein
LWAKAQNARGYTFAAAAEELSDEIYESTEELSMPISPPLRWIEN